MKRKLLAVLRIVLISSVVFLLTKAVRSGMASLSFLSEITANNITDLFCALMSCLGGAITEGVRGRKELAIQKQADEAEMARLKETHKAQLELLEKKYQLTAAEQQLAWEREARQQADSEERDRRDRLRNAHANMVSAVTAYLEMHDVNYKTAAVSSTRTLLAMAGPKLRDSLEFLLQILTRSDPFTGPGRSACESVLDQISVDLFK